MANLPRWINDIRVDSQAMLGAFLQWVHEAPPEAQREVRHLYTIDHAMMPVELTPWPQASEIRPQLGSGWSLKSLPCKAENCRRRMSLQGGYQFTWHDERRVELYSRMKREGAVALPTA